MKVRNLFHAGIHEMPDQHVRARVIASNVVFIITAVLELIVVLLNTRGYWKYGFTSIRAFIPFILLSVSLAGIVLNHYRLFFAAKLVFFLSWTLLITAFPIWRPVSVYGYYIHPMFGIISSTMVLLMFSYQKEKFFYLLFLIFSMTITVFSFEFMSLFDEAGVAEVILSQTTRVRLHIYPFFFTIFFNLVLIYVFRNNERFLVRQLEQHEVISNQNKQLDETRQKLEQSNLELENRVQVRTIELMEQNNRLTDYAFFHAHVLRAPVSRIRGLLNLLNLPINADEEVKVREMLAHAMKELDETIHLMNEKLQATNLPDSQSPESSV